MNQEQDPTSLWPHNPQEDPLMGGSDEELAKYLDLGIDFPDFGNLDNAPSGLDTPMGRLGFEPFHQQMQMQDGNHENMGMDLGQHQNGDFDFNSMQAQAATNGPNEHGLPRQIQHPYMVPSQNYHVPLTPASSEMQATKYAQQFTDGNGHVLYDRYQQSFTPLVSPAQTPLEGTFSIPEYAGMHQDFFSPLTSPAIEAQRGPESTGTTASPVDLNDLPSSRMPPTSAAKRQRRKPSTSTRASGGSRSVKQSPAMKPQTRRRQPSLTKLPASVLDILTQESKSNNRAKASAASGKAITSSDSSVSPEPLSETLMPPPSSRSPNIQAQSQSATAGPATPATLMRMPSKRASAKGVPMNARLEDVDAMEDIMLPESVTRPALSPLYTDGVLADDQDTPTMSAKSAKLSASSTPRTAAMTPSVLSPSIPKRPESKASMRSGKKRQGTNSAAISPALRPKISPSITPLMPATTPGMAHISAETSALYLASKSNYQNILEGTHLPGVSYPEALAENLSSKRTSHKIAEQGRRNRINTALKEIEALLPQQIMANGKKERANSAEGDDGDKCGSGPGTSKASTVEMAIVYIKNLQAELKVTQDKLEVAEKNSAVRGSTSSQSSEGAP
jgi:hypothetical protein